MNSRPEPQTLRIARLLLLVFCLDRLILALFFFFSRLRPEAFWCLGSAVFYGALLALCGFRPGICLTACRVEVCVSALVMTLLSGWSAGFYLYVMTMLATTLFFTRPGLKQSVWLQCGGILTLAAAIALAPWCPTHLNRLDAALDDRYPILFAFNLLVACILILIHNDLIARQMKAYQNKMEARSKKLEYLATHDALTGLSNRRSMTELLSLCHAQATRSHVPFSVAMGDIDNFKAFNDTYGHSYGDQILTTLAQLIQTSTREGDFVCRWGGEEILILFSATSVSAARAVLERIQSRLRKPGSKEGALLSTPVTMTFGVSEYQTGQTVEQLIQDADEKLYRGKAGGKDCIVL